MQRQIIDSFRKCDCAKKTAVIAMKMVLSRMFRDSTIAIFRYLGISRRRNSQTSHHNRRIRA